MIRRPNRLKHDLVNGINMFLIILSFVLHKLLHDCATSWKHHTLLRSVHATSTCNDCSLHWEYKWRFKFFVVFFWWFVCEVLILHNAKLKEQKHLQHNTTQQNSRSRKRNVDFQLKFHYILPLTLFTPLFCYLLTHILLKM